VAKLSSTEYIDSLPEERRAKIVEALAQERRRRRRFAVLFMVIFALCVVAFLGLNVIAKRGRTLPDNGISAVAHIDRAQAGNCGVGEKHAHCYRLFLTIHQPASSPYAAQLDVNIADRWASRIQPGAVVSVVIDPADSAKVYLDVNAFASPPPVLPAPATSIRPATQTAPR